VMVAAPIDVIPLFVKAGSILPLGEAVESTNERQRIAKVKVYPGADGEFELYRDDGTTYEYEKGKSELSRFNWSDGAKKLMRSGAKAEVVSEDGLVEVVGAAR
jgi:alpha-D-xyloside xylohydrolase